jgi:hypothetical protein
MAFGSWFVERIEKEAKEAVVYRGRVRADLLAPSWLRLLPLDRHHMYVPCLNDSGTRLFRVLVAALAHAAVVASLALSALAEKREHRLLDLLHISHLLSKTRVKLEKQGAER